MMLEKLKLSAQINSLKQAKMFDLLYQPINFELDLKMFIFID